MTFDRAVIAIKEEFGQEVADAFKSQAEPYENGELLFETVIDEGFTLLEWLYKFTKWDRTNEGADFWAKLAIDLKQRV